MRKEKGLRESEKPDDGLVNNFLGRPIKKHSRDEDPNLFQPFIYLDPWAYDSLLVRILILVLKVIQITGSVVATVMFIGFIGYAFVRTIGAIFQFARSVVGI